MNTHTLDSSNGAHSSATPCTIEIDGVSRTATIGEPLVDVLNRIDRIIPQVCYHPQLGPIQTCDTCMLQVNGNFARACGTPVAEGMLVVTHRTGRCGPARSLRSHPGQSHALLHGL